MNYKSLLLLSSVSLMWGCFSDETITNASKESKDTSVITMKIVDSKSGLPIDSAMVYSELEQDTLYSDSLGIVTWEKNVLGDYSYIVAKEGYASTIATITVEESGKGDVPRVANNILTVDMHVRGVTVNGTVLIKDTKTDNLSAASKIPVIVKYIDGDVYPAEVATKTDASGVFSFENLAENSTYEIVVPQAEIEGQTYEVVGDAQVVEGLRAGEVRSLSPITMNVVGLVPELIRTNFATLDTIDEGSYIHLTFSTELVADSVPTAWSVYKNGVAEGKECVGGTEVLISAALKEKKMIVVNSVSNKWNRDNYCIEGSVFTKEGRSQKFAMNFNPGALSERPSNVLKLTYDPDDRKLSWTVDKAEKPGLSGYKVFYRTNRMADFIEFTTLGSKEDTEMFIDIYDMNHFGDASLVYFYVLPYVNVNGKVVLSEVTEDTPMRKIALGED